MKRKTRILFGVVFSVHLFFFCFNFKHKTVPPKPKQSIVVHTHMPIVFHNLGVSQSQRQRLSPTETASYPRDRSNAARTEDLDADAEKNQILNHDRCTPPPPKSQAHTLPQEVTRKAPKKITPSKHGNTFKEIEETLAHIETKPPPPSNLTLPKEIRSLQIDHQDPAQKTDYFIQLAQSLKEGLELPEQGEVKLELTVSKSGQVLRLHIVHALSEANRRYLELNLPKIKLPPFSEELKDKHAHTFTLTFCNAS